MGPKGKQTLRGTTRTTGTTGTTRATPASKKKTKLGKSKSKSKAKPAAPKKEKREKPRGSAAAKERAIHVLLRVRSENGATIAAHKEMAATKGMALLGKMGQAIGPDFLKLLNGQIDRGVSTFLFLTTREGWNGPYVTYQCSLQRVYDTLNPAKQSFIPAYYRWDTASVKTWFEIGSVERMTRDEMNKIFVVSSGRSIMSVIASSATVFRVGTA